jgi:MATE family multidrug resistance protein
VSVMWLNMGAILVALGEDPEIAQAAQSYVYWLVPILVSYGLLFPVIKFFQTQRAVFQLMICSAVTVICHVPLCWLIIDKLQVGFKGAAVAMNISLAINLGLLFAFLKFSSRFEKTFISLSWEAFQNFGDFFRLAIPSAIMMWYEITIYLKLLNSLSSHRRKKT